MTPEKIKSNYSFMEVSEQDNFSNGGTSQKKWPTILGPQKDSLPKLTVCVSELIIPPTHDPMTSTTHFLLDMAEL